MAPCPSRDVAIAEIRNLYANYHGLHISDDWPTRPLALQAILNDWDHRTDDGSVPGALPPFVSHHELSLVLAAIDYSEFPSYGELVSRNYPDNIAMTIYQCNKRNAIQCLHERAYPPRPPTLLAPVMAEAPSVPQPGMPVTAQQPPFDPLEDRKAFINGREVTMRGANVVMSREDFNAHVVCVDWTRPEAYALRHFVEVYNNQTKPENAPPIDLGPMYRKMSAQRPFDIHQIHHPSPPVDMPVLQQETPMLHNGLAMDVAPAFNHQAFFDPSMGLESFAAQPLNDSYMDLDDINMPASLYAAPVVSWTPFGVPVPDTCPSLGEIAEVIRPLAPVEAMEVDMTPPPPPTVPALATLSWTRHGALSVRAARRIKAEAACLPPAPIGPLIAQPPVVPSPPLTDEEWELAQLPTLRPPSLVAARDIIMPPESDEDEEEEERPRRRMTFIAAAAGEIIWKELSQIFLRCDISFRDEPIIVRSLREKLEQFQVSGYKDVVVENVLNDIYRRARLMRNTKAQEYYQRMPGYELIGNPYGITRNIKLEY